jgi:hypothetical protein
MAVRFLEEIKSLAIEKKEISYLFKLSHVKLLAK